MTRFHIGIDSTDSSELGMCTTYLGAVLLERLSSLELELISFPELVRLNPNVPWKTRGNGAVCLRYESNVNLEKKIIEITEDAIQELSVFEDPQTNPGFALLKGSVPDDIRSLYHRSLHEIVPTEDALNAGKVNGVYMRGWKNKRGVIGALSAIGADLSEHTYEAIQYRPGSVKDRERMVDVVSLVNSSRHHKSTFFNVDDNGSPVCIPRSPCPVILGIRGTDPADTLDALRDVELEDAERWVLWKTNQHTDAHIQEMSDISKAPQYSSISCRVEVMKNPIFKEGGHLFIGAEDEFSNPLDIAVYEPTKGFRKELAELIQRDLLTVWGSIRKDDVPRITINLEKARIEKLAEKRIISNPRCPKCGGSTTSMGKEQGLRCKKCRYRGSDLEQIEEVVQREIVIGLIEPPQDAWRHLFKPSSLPKIKEKEYTGLYFGNGRP